MNSGYFRLFQDSGGFSGVLLASGGWKKVCVGGVKIYPPHTQARFARAPKINEKAKIFQLEKDD